jgi:queuine tRNA-ribosyltransferase
MSGCFELLQTDPTTHARRGRLTLAHGTIETPIFMPVGTQASVKSVHPQELRDLNAQIILGNTYHLNLRPGLPVIKAFGGLHSFMQWDRPILTDSGGFQVFSLAKLRKITREGVKFQSHLDGSPCFLGPETAMEIQAGLGSDIAMLFDECPPYPCERKYAETSLELTEHWADRCRSWITEHRPLCTNGVPQRHFGIVQGSVWKDLRERAAQRLVEMDFDGYAIGGVSVGEGETEMLHAVDWVVPHLPTTKPRYTMGVGTPPQLLAMIARGVDMFDCVLPTRVARHGSVYTREGLINLRNKQFELDHRPLDPAGTAPGCVGFSRGYVRHLLRSGEILGLRLITQHNLWFFLNLMQEARHAIEQGDYAAFQADFTARYLSGKKSPTSSTPTPNSIL